MTGQVPGYQALLIKAERAEILDGPWMNLTYVRPEGELRTSYGPHLLVQKAVTKMDSNAAGSRHEDLLCMSIILDFAPWVSCTTSRSISAI